MNVSPELAKVHELGLVPLYWKEDRLDALLFLARQYDEGMFQGGSRSEDWIESIAEESLWSLTRVGGNGVKTARVWTLSDPLIHLLVTRERDEVCVELVAL